MTRSSPAPCDRPVPPVKPMSPELVEGLLIHALRLRAVRRDAARLLEPGHSGKDTERHLRLLRRAVLKLHGEYVDVVAIPELALHLACCERAAEAAAGMLPEPYDALLADDGQMASADGTLAIAKDQLGPGQLGQAPAPLLPGAGRGRAAAAVTHRIPPHARDRRPIPTPQGSGIGRGPAHARPGIVKELGPGIQASAPE